MVLTTTETQFEECRVRLSLLRFHQRLRTTGASAALAALTAFAVLLLLTPCCDVEAAITAPIQTGVDDHSVDHAHDHDAGAPSTGDSCAAWTDNNNALVDNSAALPTAGFDLAVHWVDGYAAPIDILFTSLPPPSVHSPPAIPAYLLYAHLLF